jgi:hypothetical protein
MNEDVNNITLHEAIKIVLNEMPEKTATINLISKEIEERNLYRQKTGGVAQPFQIFLRAKKYPDLFEIVDTKTIKLKKRTPDRISEPQFDGYKVNTLNLAESVVNHLKRNTKPLTQVTNFSDSPGIYAFLFYGREFPLKQAIEYVKVRPIIYVGKTESSSYKRDLEQHLNSGKTGSSTLRRSLGSILREELSLTSVPRSEAERSKRKFSHYKFTPDGEDKLTEWMKENLAFSFYEMNVNPSEISVLEKQVIKLTVPVLNLRNNYGNIFYSLIENARHSCIEEAKR